MEVELSMNWLFLIEKHWALEKASIAWMWQLWQVGVKEEERAVAVAVER